MLDGVFMYTMVCRMVTVICFDNSLSEIKSVIRYTSIYITRQVHVSVNYIIMRLIKCMHAYM